MIFNPEDIGGYTIMSLFGLIYFIFAIPAILRRFKKKEFVEGISIILVSSIILVGFVVSVIGVIRILF